MPEFHAYDGYWMLLGAAIAVAGVAPLVWRWPRQRSLPAIVLAAILGSWLPIVWLAYRGHVPLLPRLKGAWYLMGADVIGAAIPVGAACLWMALRESDPRHVEAALRRTGRAVALDRRCPSFARTVGFECRLPTRLGHRAATYPRIHSLSRWWEIVTFPMADRSLPPAYQPHPPGQLDPRAGSPAGFHLANRAAASPGRRACWSRSRERGGAPGWTSRLAPGARPGRAGQALALLRGSTRAHPEDWRYWLLAGEAAVRAGHVRLPRAAPLGAAPRRPAALTAGCAPTLPGTPAASALPPSPAPLLQNPVPVGRRRPAQKLSPASQHLRRGS